MVMRVDSEGVLMPIHDWTRVDAGIFHHFHHGWIEEIARALNRSILPADYYALAEQHAAKFGPDVLTLQATSPSSGDVRDIPARGNGPASGSDRGVVLAPPRAHLVGETDLAFYRRKQKVVAVRHVSGDDLVAVVEIVSPGNRSSRRAFRDFVEKASSLLDLGIHLLVIDLFPPSRLDPSGIHGAVWQEMTDQEYHAPADKPLTLASYEAALGLRAYVEHLAVGDPLIDMPLFLRAGAHVPVPLGATYQSAWEAVPQRWRTVIEGRT
jgi:hypothetical protein